MITLFLALPVALGCFAFAIFAPKAGTTVYLALAYLAFAVIRLSVGAVSRAAPKDSDEWTPEDEEILREHFATLTFFTVRDFGRSINLLRVLGLLLFLPLALWNRLWFQAAFLGAYFFVVGYTLVRCDPFHYYRGGAARGHPLAISRLRALQRIVTIRELREKLRDRGELPADEQQVLDRYKVDAGLERSQARIADFEHRWRTR